MTDCKTITKEEYIAQLEKQVQQLREANRQKEKSNRTLQRQISKLQIELQKSHVRPTRKSLSNQLVLFIELLIAGFALSIGAMGAVGWVLWLSEVVNG